MKNGGGVVFFGLCRPMSADEEKLHTPVVIRCVESKREVCAVQTVANKQIDRSFVFDKVFFKFLSNFVRVYYIWIQMLNVFRP